MDSKKYIGMDVHKESISIAVMNGAGKIVMESVIETKASMILQFIDGLRGDLQVTFEEGTSAAWLYDLLKPHVTKLLVCDPRKNASMREGNQSDKIDARRLAELLRLNHLNPVYHGEHGLRSLTSASRGNLGQIGDEENIGRILFGRRVSQEDIGMEERWALDAKLKSAALAKGYDSIVLMTPKAFSEFRTGIKLPRSMELNILNAGRPPSGGRRLRGSV
jgi:transposase